MPILNLRHFGQGFHSINDIMRCKVEDVGLFFITISEMKK